jgi:hypothetical protein
MHNTIWTFWHEDPLPSFIQNCINSWKKTNATINVITDKTIGDYIDTNSNMNTSPQRRSDLLRLEVLSKYGGLWLDASIICFSTFDWVFNQEKCTVFSIPEIGTDPPVIESWFIYCKKGDPFIKKWRDEFNKIGEYNSIDDYINSNNIDIKGIDYPDYLAVYVAARAVYTHGCVSLCNASTGPYKYHTKGGVKYLIEEKPSFVKFRSVDRHNITPEIEYELFKEVSHSI